MKILTRKFFARKPETVARELLGKILVRQKEGSFWIGKIVETEAYLGPGDKASHSHKGMTPRNEVMFGPAGYSYVYFTYGMHWLLNIITEDVGKPSGVLIRALEPATELKKINGELEIVEPKKQAANGPAKLTKWMQINKSLNKIDITKSELLFITDELKINNQAFKSEKISPKSIVSKPRVGIDYAGEHKNLLLRFYIKDSLFVSKK